MTRASPQASRSGTFTVSSLELVRTPSRVMPTSKGPSMVAAESMSETTLLWVSCAASRRTCHTARATQAIARIGRRRRPTRPMAYPLLCAGAGGAESAGGAGVVRTAGVTAAGGAACGSAPAMSTPIATLSRIMARK